MDILLSIYQYAVWFFAGLLTGLTSFGGNLFAIPLLTLAMPAQDAIIIACLSGMVMIIGLSLLYWRAARWGEIASLGLSSVPGVVLGVAFLQHAGPRLLLLAAGASIALFLLWHFLSGRLHVGDTPVSRWWGLPCGLAGGLMMGAVGMGGPPIVLYAYLRHWSKESTIGSISLTAAITMLALLPAQWGAGLYTGPLLKTSLMSALFSLMGILASVPLVNRIDTLLFRRLLLLMLAISAFMLLVRGAFA